MNCKICNKKLYICSTCFPIRRNKMEWVMHISDNSSLAYANYHLGPDHQLTADRVEKLKLLK